MNVDDEREEMVGENFERACLGQVRVHPCARSAGIYRRCHAEPAQRVLSLLLRPDRLS